MTSGQSDRGRDTAYAVPLLFTEEFEVVVMIEVVDRREMGRTEFLT